MSTDSSFYGTFMHKGTTDPGVLLFKLIAVLVEMLFACKRMVWPPRRKYQEKYLLAVAGEIEVGDGSGTSVLDSCHVVSSSSFFLRTCTRKNIPQRLIHRNFCKQSPTLLC